jgi:glycosyltransferase 2 family protein
VTGEGPRPEDAVWTIRAGGRRGAARLVSLGASLALLIALYRSLDVRQVGQALLAADPVWLVTSIGMILPITLLRALRFFWIAPNGALSGPAEALRLTLAASALNAFAPAKTGDLIKSYHVAMRSETEPAVAVAIVVYERLCDMVGLLGWCLLAWVVSRPTVPGLTPVFWPLLGAFGIVCTVFAVSERAARLLPSLVQRVLPAGAARRLRPVTDAWPGVLRLLRDHRGWIVVYSLLLWLAHFIQIWLFTVALGAGVPFTVTASLSAVALLAGQLPFTVAGIGPRDLALVMLLSRYVMPEVAAALGILIATRGLLPSLVGMPVMWPYLSTVVADARRWRRNAET